MLEQFPEIAENSQENIHDTATFLISFLVMDNFCKYLTNFQKPIKNITVGVFYYRSIYSGSIVGARRNILPIFDLFP